MRDFKYNLGDFVAHVVRQSFDCKMVVTGRVTEEYDQHTESYYICSGFRVGEFFRQKLAESELAPWIDKPKEDSL